MKIYTQKIKAEISLQKKLEVAYTKRQFKNLPEIIKTFMYNDLYRILKIKNRYLAFNFCFNYVFKTFEKKYLASLSKININNLVTRSRLDANLIINSPSNTLYAINDYFTKVKKKFTDTEENDNYMLFLYWGIGSNNTYDVELIEEINQDLRNQIKKAKTEKEKKELEQQIIEVEKLKELVISKEIVDYFSKDRWNSQFLPNSRPAHMQAHNQVRGFDGYFTVGGEKLSYPGDFDNGSIGNVINCRCFLTR